MFATISATPLLPSMFYLSINKPFFPVAEAARRFQTFDTYPPPSLKQYLELEDS